MALWRMRSRTISRIETGSLQEHMSKRIKFGLPAFQTAFAVLLMWLNWRTTPFRTGVSLESQISYGINMPAASLSLIVASHSTMSVAEWLVIIHLFYFALVALLWYAVAIEISGRHRGSLLMAKLTRRRGFRITADVVLVGVGLLLLQGAFMNLVFPHGGDQRIPMATGALLWGGALAWLYSRDFWFTVCAQRQQQAGRE